MTICYWNRSPNDCLQYIFTKGNSPTLSASRRGGIWYLVLTSSQSSWERGGPIVGPKAHPLPRNWPGEHSSAWVQVWPLPEICMGEEGLDIELGAWPLPLKDKGLPWFNSLPLPHVIICSLIWVFLPKGGSLPQEGLYHDHYHSYYCEDLVLNHDLFPYH